MSNVKGGTRMARLRRRARVRKKVNGTADVPRLSVYRSLNHIYAQVIDDFAGNTLVWASSLKMELPALEEDAAVISEEAKDGKKGKKGKAKAKPASKKIRRSIDVGRRIAELAKEKGIEKVVFDRGGFLYHGRIAALAEAARNGGLKF